MYPATTRPSASTETRKGLSWSRRGLLAPLAFVLALLLSTTVGDAVHALGDLSAAVRQTAKQLVQELAGKFVGAAAGEPVLVRSAEDRTPEYFLVPLRKNGRILGLVGMGANGAAW